MEKTLVMFLAALVCSGCDRSTVSGPDGVRSSTQVVQVVVIDGFGDNASTLTTSTYVRVGTYFDFSPFDSLRISFKATRLTAQLPFDEILIRIGPTCYIRDSVYATEKNVEFTVRADAISKRQFCALSFLTTDSRVLLKLSDLRVVGWMSK